MIKWYLIQKRLQISLSKQSTKRLEDVSKETGLTKSVIIELALNDYFKKERVIRSKHKKTHSWRSWVLVVYLIIV